METVVDMDKDDLVLHEGDGKVQRPSKSTENPNRKKMPSPRKVKISAEVLKPEEQPKVAAAEGFFANQPLDDDDDDGNAQFEDWDDDDRKRRAALNATNPTPDQGPEQQFELTQEDLEICRRLDDEYERALEERDIGYNARYSSVRQTAIFSLVFLVIYMIQGTYVYRELLLLNNEHNSRVFALEEGDEFDNQFKNWSISESLFFSIFTITTVGYGREDLPTTPAFQAYTIIYILVGIATLTIVVAQVYQCIALEASRARLSQDKQARKSGLMINPNESGRSQPSVTSPTGSSQHSGGKSDEIMLHSRHVNTGCVPRTLESFFRCLDRAKHFFRETEVGRGISVVFPFVGLILSGAIVVCPLEGWTFLESLYFAVVSLTTVGYGDYVPTKLPTIWFCIFWLPFSIGFMSMYLSNIATFYIRLSDRNIRRIERRLRRRLQKAKEVAEEERAEVLRRAYRGQETEIEIIAGSADNHEGNDELRSPVRFKRRDSGRSSDDSSIDDGVRHATIPMNHARSVMRREKKRGFNVLPTSDDGANSDDETVLIGTSEKMGLEKTGLFDTGHRRRQRIIENCRNSMVTTNLDGNITDDIQSGTATRTIKSMKDVIRAVRNTLNSENSGAEANPPDMDLSKFMSIQSTQNMIDYSIFRRQEQSKKPSFALRVLVQERFAEIIAIEVAGYHSSIEIKDHTLSVAIHSLSDTADKWFVPRRARKAFRAVAFEILYFVGEHGLITRGADALYDLTPFEFHGLFSSLVAAMGDADTMEGWLDKTDTLALVDLQKGVLHRSAPEDDDKVSERKGVFRID